MSMNPVRVTYPVAATGAQTAISIDWRDSPTGCSYEVQFNGSATGTCKVQSTLDNINDTSITADWVDETGSLTSDTRGVIAHPVAAIRLNFSVAVGTDTVTFKVLVGAQIGDASGVVPSGGGGSTENVNVAQWGGTATTLGSKAMTASVPVVLASDQTQFPTTLGAKTAAASLAVALATDQINANGQATMANSSPVVIASNQSSIPVTNTPLTNFGAGEYETVAASQTAQVLGATGAAGDYLSGLLVIPASTSPGQVLLLDNATSITVFAGGASSVTSLIPFFIPCGMISVSGAWKVTTGANVSVIGIGNFT